MLALLAYPILIEPQLVLQDQTAGWVWGFLGLIALVVVCGLISTANAAPAAGAEPVKKPEATPSGSGVVPALGQAPTWMGRFRWVVLAFVPSSLMIGVTTYMTTDITPMPLLWTIPLALYLLSFILVFSRLPLWLTVGVVLLLPVFAIYAMAYPEGVPSKGVGDYLGRATVLHEDVKLYQILAIQLAGLFAVVFLRSPRKAHVGMILLLPLVVIGVIFDGDFRERLGMRTYEQLTLHLAALFVACMVCHGELARTRPAAGRLTEFYLLMSLGGVLGGLFNGLVAPLVFNHIVEYPLLLVVPCLLMPSFGLVNRDGTPRFPWIEPMVTGGLFAFGLLVALFLLARSTVSRKDAEEWAKRHLGGSNQEWALWLARHFSQDGIEDHHAVLVPNPALFFRSERAPAGEVRNVPYDLTKSTRAVHMERNFFGAFVVQEFNYHYVRRKEDADAGKRWFEAPDPDDMTLRYHALYHGTTTHGLQCLTEGYRDMPLAYFHREGPIGQLFRAMETRELFGAPLQLTILAAGAGTPWTVLAEPRLAQEQPDLEPKRRVGILGVGTGTLAAYAKPGWELTLFDIDPAVVRVATNPEYFTFLSDARERGVKIDIKLGDGRLLLDREPDGYFDMLFMDAFNSDSVPVHLLTREALAIYKKKLKPDGVLIVNLSNRYLDFSPTMANLARDGGMKVRIQVGMEDKELDKYGSVWAVMVFDEKDLGILPELTDVQATERHRKFGYGVWYVPEPNAKQPVWTDGYSNLLQIFRWRN
jgi:SAM-dependent methyltransferase